MNLNFPARITANVPFQDQIQEPYFKHSSCSTISALLSWHCFMLMPPFVDNTWPIIQYTVSAIIFFAIMLINTLIVIIRLIKSFTVCLLNLHEDERLKPRAWVPVGWLPVYNEKSASSRPARGFHSSTACKMQLYHQCWIEFLDKWAVKTSNPERRWS